MLNENIICNFLKLSIEQLQAVIPPTYHSWNRLTIEREDNGYGISPSTRPNFSNILDTEGVYEYLLPVNDFAEILEKDARYKKIQHKYSISSDVKGNFLNPYRILILLLKEYLCLIEYLKYEEQSAIQLAKSFLRFLDNSILEMVVYSVVRGLECDFECYTLSPDIQLRKLTDDEIVQIIERNDAFFQNDTLQINHRLLKNDNLVMNRCLLEQRLQIPINKQVQILTPTTRIFDEVITALRLLKEGRVERQDTYMRPEYPGQLAVVNTHMGKINQRFPISQTYALSETDMPALIEILTAIKSGRIPVRLQTAVDRVNFAAERDRADDRLLDLLIAMEALFGDSQGAIGYKIGLRCAVFVENDYEKRSRITQLINDAYSRRSALVHGGKSKSMGTLRLTTDEIVKELLFLIQKSTNLIIKRLLSGGNIPDGQEFDKMLLQQARN
ncbi:MAG: HEPN domain-containing protein [Cyanobacteriota bacterium]|nr:HEPN domain-containing protein [Cyanobacteriota bacterium]